MVNPRRLWRPSQDGEHCSGAERLRVTGHIRIRSYDAHTGKLVDEQTWHNLLTTNGRYALLNVLGGSSGYSTCQYIAVGTGAPTAPVTGPLVSDTRLWNELTRSALVNASVAGNQVTFAVYFTSSQALGTWTECGMFGTNPSQTASLSGNSGVLLTHAQLSYTKTTSYQTTLTYTITLS